MVGGFCNYQNVLNHTEGRLKCIVSKTLAAFTNALLTLDLFRRPLFFFHLLAGYYSNFE
jgi:hypothetical protein